MKTTLFLNDEAAEATLLLQDTVPAKATVREPEAVADCNCERWGHPCPRCLDKQNVQSVAAQPDFPLARK